LVTDSCLDLDFPAVSGKQVIARFDGGDITSDSGLLLVNQADSRLGLIAALASAVQDRRQSAKVSFDLETLLRERVFSIVAGHEDANDLDALRRDAALKLACGRVPGNEDLASQPTISRLENSVTRRDLVRVGAAICRQAVSALPADTRRVYLDTDAMEDPCHGQQEFEAFNAYYDSHCYLPMLAYMTGDDGRQHLVGAVLRPGKCAPTAGLTSLVRRVVKQLRSRFGEIEIILRGDAAFGCNKVLRFCERYNIRFLLGLSTNPRVRTLATPILMDACIKYSQLKYRPVPAVCQEYGVINYKAGTWAKKETVVVKAEVTQGDLNPRYVVTDLPCEDPEEVYNLYCERGDRENRIKEFKLDMFAGRTSCHRFLANQFRLLLHAAAMVLMEEIQAAAHGTQLAKAQASTIRLKLIKIGARIVESCRRVWVHLSSSCPYQATWRHVHAALVT
jgi:hypothetical protein